MSKKSREAIRDNLARAIAPPTPARKRSAHLDGLLDEYAPPEQDTLAIPSRVANQSALATETPVATEALEPLPLARVANQSTVANLSALIAQEPVTSNWTPWPNDLWDKVMPNLKPQDQAVLARLYRLSRGWRSETCHISLPKLAKACHISEREAHRSLARLQQHSLISRVSYDFGNKNKAERGMHIRVHLPEVSIDRQATVAKQSRVASKSRGDTPASNKDKALKENISKGEIHRLSPEDLQSFTATVRDHLMDGKAIEEIEAQFAAGLHPDDWQKIREAALSEEK